MIVLGLRKNDPKLGRSLVDEADKRHPRKYPTPPDQRSSGLRVD